MNLRSTPITSPVSKEMGRYNDLEAYRGVAALAIVVFHAYQSSRITAAYIYQGTPLHFILRNLDGGVSVFLALSGFLIFLPFVRALLGQGKPQSAHGFLIRRAIRILPLYYVAISLIWSIRFGGGTSQWTSLIEHLTFTQIFDNRFIFWDIGPAWSLAVEVLFYLGIALSAPALQWICNRLKQSSHRVALLIGFVTALIAASVAYKALVFYGFHISEDNNVAYYNPLAKLDLFALGMLLAIVVALTSERPILKGWKPALLRWAGVAMLIPIFILREQNDFIYLFFHTFCGLFTVMWLASTVLAERGTNWEKRLSNPILMFIGTISYSVYIWHEPIMLELESLHWINFQNALAFPFSTIAFLLVVILAGGVSYYIIEYPTQYLRHLFTRDGQLVNRYQD
jgi:peptidoglycan/LPS O-acetylase OafA/YrhL